MTAELQPEPEALGWYADKDGDLFNHDAPNSWVRERHGSTWDWLAVSEYAPLRRLVLEQGPLAEAIPTPAKDGLDPADIIDLARRSIAEAGSALSTLPGDYGFTVAFSIRTPQNGPTLNSAHERLLPDDARTRAYR